MIASFAHKETERIWNGLRSRKLPPDIQQRALAKLQQLAHHLLLELQSKIRVRHADPGA